MAKFTERDLKALVEVIKNISANTPMPENRLGLENGAVIEANDDYPFFGLEKGDRFPVFWGGEYVQAFSLTWSVDSICTEIERGDWSLVESEAVQS